MDKVFATRRGEPLLARAVRRLQLQVETVAVNSNAEPERLAALGMPIVSDSMPGYPGPLAGILAALRKVGGEDAMRLVDFGRDEKVLGIMKAWPGSFENDAALRLGFVRDDTETGFEDAVRDFKRELETNYGAW